MRVHMFLMALVLGLPALYAAGAYAMDQINPAHLRTSSTPPR